MIGSFFKKINICHIYIVLWIVLYLQYNVFHNSLMVLLSLGPALILSIYYMVYSFQHYNNSVFIKALFCFVMLMMFYGLLLIISGQTIRGKSGDISDNRQFLLGVVTSISPIFAFYVFARKGKLTKVCLLWSFFVFLGLYIIEYFAYETSVLNALTTDQLSSENFGVTNKAGYHMASLLPFLFLFRKKPAWQFFVFIPIGYFTIMSMKRGAILVAALCMVWFVMRTFSEHSKRMRVATIILIIVGFTYLLSFLTDLAQNNAYFQLRLEDTLEGGTSGRTDIYGRIWEHYINGNLFQLLFGYGANETVKVTGMSAHNDWLELLLDCGIFGVIIFLFYWISFFKSFQRAKNAQVIYSVLGGLFVYTLARTAFSMSYGDMTIPACMGIAYCVAYVDLQKNNIFSIDDLS